MKKQTIDKLVRAAENARNRVSKYSKQDKQNLTNAAQLQINIAQDYPRIFELGLTVITKCPNSIPGIDGKELAKKLGKKKTKIFSDLFGCQTCGENGMHVYDVEAILERMASGKLQGTQKFWD